MKPEIPILTCLSETNINSTGLKLVKWSWASRNFLQFPSLDYFRIFSRAEDVFDRRRYDADHDFDFNYDGDLGNHDSEGDNESTVAYRARRDCQSRHCTTVSKFYLEFLNYADIEYKYNSYINIIYTGPDSWSDYESNNTEDTKDQAKDTYRDAGTSKLQCDSMNCWTKSALVYAYFGLHPNTSN